MPNRTCIWSTSFSPRTRLNNESGSPPSRRHPAHQAQQDLFAADVLRYFLLREIPFGQDGSFSFDALITRYNADLANGYGNLVSRTLTLIVKGARDVILPVHADGLFQIRNSNDQSVDARDAMRMRTAILGVNCRSLEAALHST